MGRSDAVTNPYAHVEQRRRVERLRRSKRELVRGYTEVNELEAVALEGDALADETLAAVEQSLEDALSEVRTLRRTGGPDG